MKDLLPHSLNKLKLCFLRFTLPGYPAEITEKLLIVVDSYCCLQKTVLGRSIFVKIKPEKNSKKSSKPLSKNELTDIHLTLNNNRSQPQHSIQPE